MNLSHKEVNYTWSMSSHSWGHDAWIELEFISALIWCYVELHDMIVNKTLCIMPLNILYKFTKYTFIKLMYSTLGWFLACRSSCCSCWVWRSTWIRIVDYQESCHFYVRKSAVCLVDGHSRDLFPERLLGPILKESGFAFSTFLYPTQLDGLPRVTAVGFTSTASLKHSWSVCGVIILYVIKMNLLG